jgi:hypothetical protein
MNHCPPTRITTDLHEKYPHPTHNISLSSPVILYRNPPTLAKALRPRLLSNQHPNKAPTIKRYNNHTHTKQTIKQSKPTATTTPSCLLAVAQ